jgi:hypothetical protein
MLPVTLTLKLGLRTLGRDTCNAHALTTLSGSPVSSEPKISVAYDMDQPRKGTQSQCYALSYRASRSETQSVILKKTIAAQPTVQYRESTKNVHDRDGCLL